MYKTDKQYSVKRNFSQNRNQYAGKGRSGGSGRSFGRRSNTSSGTIHFSKFINRSSENTQEKPYVPACTFLDFPFEGRLKSNIEKKGYKTPTEIQDKTIPFIMDGKDVIGIANTGTGKTAAFLLPLINKVLKNKREKVLIITPTRELAFQINDELFSFTRSLGIYSATCIGGSSMGLQLSRLRQNPNFVIGTPGRLKDLVTRKRLMLGGFQNIVLDEADRMLDMGFIDDIRSLMDQLSKERQTLLFSATIPSAIESLIRTFLNDPVKVSVKSRETAANVDQDIVRVKDGNEKIEKLCSFLVKKEEFQKVLVFGKTKHGVERLSQELDKRGFRSASIHGDKPQAKRRQALDLFKTERVQILVATDVAARGLDIANVSHVINFDIPSTYEDYVHRIGRTGRADQKGVALTFVS